MRKTASVTKYNTPAWGKILDLNPPPTLTEIAYERMPIKPSQMKQSGCRGHGSLRRETRVNMRVSYSTVCGTCKRDQPPPSPWLWMHLQGTWVARACRRNGRRDSVQGTDSNDRDIVDNDVNLHLGTNDCGARVIVRVRDEIPRL